MALARARANMVNVAYLATIERHVLYTTYTNTGRALLAIPTVVLLSYSKDLQETELLITKMHRLPFLFRFFMFFTQT